MGSVQFFNNNTFSFNIIFTGGNLVENWGQKLEVILNGFEQNRINIQRNKQQQLENTKRTIDIFCQKRDSIIIPCIDRIIDAIKKHGHDATRQQIESTLGEDGEYTLPSISVIFIPNSYEHILGVDKKSSPTLTFTHSPKDDNIKICQTKLEGSTVGAGTIKVNNISEEEIAKYLVEWVEHILNDVSIKENHKK